MDQVIAMSKVVLNKSNQNLEIIDYDDMVYLPLQRDLRMLQNDWVLIDEAQDTNPTRRALAKNMLKPGGRLVAVGDPHQAIFGFTGADNDSLNIIEQEFQCARMPLTVTYRCPKAVVQHARNWVSHITAHDSAPEGELLRMDYDADFFATVIQAMGFPFDPAKTTDPGNFWSNSDASDWYSKTTAVQRTDGIAAADPTGQAENWATYSVRMQAAAALIEVAAGAEEGNTLVVSHGGPIAAMLQLMDRERFDPNADVANGSVSLSHGF